MVLDLLIAMALVPANGFFVASEFSLARLRPTQVGQFERDRCAKARGTDRQYRARRDARVRATHAAACDRWRAGAPRTSRSLARLSSMNHYSSGVGVILTTTSKFGTRGSTKMTRRGSCSCSPEELGCLLGGARSPSARPRDGSPRSPSSESARSTNRSSRTYRRSIADITAPSANPEAALKAHPGSRTGPTPALHPMHHRKSLTSTPINNKHPSEAVRVRSMGSGPQQHPEPRTKTRLPGGLTAIAIVTE